MDERRSGQNESERFSIDIFIFLRCIFFREFFCFVLFKAKCRFFSFRTWKNTATHTPNSRTTVNRRRRTRPHQSNASPCFFRRCSENAPSRSVFAAISRSRTGGALGVEPWDMSLRPLKNIYGRLKKGGGGGDGGDGGSGSMKMSRLTTLSLSLAVHRRVLPPCLATANALMGVR